MDVKPERLHFLFSAHTQSLLSRKNRCFHQLYTPPKPGVQHSGITLTDGLPDLTGALTMAWLGPV